MAPDALSQPAGSLWSQQSQGQSPSATLWKVHEEAGSLLCLLLAPWGWHGGPTGAAATVLGPRRGGRRLGGCWLQGRGSFPHVCGQGQGYVRAWHGPGPGPRHQTGLRPQPKSTRSLGGWGGFHRQRQTDRQTLKSEQVPAWPQVRRGRQQTLEPPTPPAGEPSWPSQSRSCSHCPFPVNSIQRCFCFIYIKITRC